MKNINFSDKAAWTLDRRKGSVLVLGLGLMIILFAFAALAVDISFITTSRTQLQKSADAAALAANLELIKTWGAGSTSTEATRSTVARAAAAAVAASNNAAGRNSTYINSTTDVRLGYRQWDEVNGQWTTQWGVTPYTAVEVTVRRNNPGSNLGDGPLNLFFAPVIGTRNATVAVKATAALRAGVSTKRNHGQNPGILPITLDVGTWDNMIAAMLSGGAGTDNYTYNESTGAVSQGADGIYEVNLYPEGNAVLPPGNRGTVDFGASGNSTSDITRQILYGLNDDDLSHLGGELDFEAVPMDIYGDTGLSAGIKDELVKIIGIPKMIPLFSTVSGPGNNAIYTIVRFVPIRVLYVKLTGKPASKRVMIQPAVYSDSTVVGGDAVIEYDSILAPVGLVN